MDRSKQFQRRASLAAGILLLCLGGLVAYERRRNQRRLSEVLAAAHADGLPIDVSEVTYPRVPKENDARPFYQKASKLTEGKNLYAIEEWARFPTPTKEQMALQELPSFLPAYRIILEGTKRKSINRKGREEQSVRSLSPFFPNNAASILLAHARAASLRKDRAGALRDVQALQHLAGQVAEWPTMDDKTNAIDVQRKALQALRYCLVAGCDPRVVERLATAIPLPDWREGFRTDFILELEANRHSWFGPNGNRGEEMLDGLYRSTGLLDRNTRAYVRSQREAWRTFPKDPEDFETLIEAMKQWEDNSQDRGNILTMSERAVMEPTNSSFPFQWKICMADRRMVADAARIWQGLTTKEIDPFTGKPFQRKRGELVTLGSPSFPGDDLTAPLP